MIVSCEVTSLVRDNLPEESPNDISPVVNCERVEDTLSILKRRDVSTLGDEDHSASVRVQSQQASFRDDEMKISEYSYAALHGAL